MKELQESLRVFKAAVKKGGYSVPTLLTDSIEELCGSIVNGAKNYGRVGNKADLLRNRVFLDYNRLGTKLKELEKWSKQEKP